MMRIYLISRSSFSVFYVYYEQYLELPNRAILTLSISVGKNPFLSPQSATRLGRSVFISCLIGSVFVMTFVLIGFKLWSTILATLTVVMFLIDMMGLMYIWDISLNALALVNLTAVR